MNNKLFMIILGVVVLIVSIYFLSIVYQKVKSKLNHEDNIQNENMKIQDLEKEINDGKLQKLVLAGGCFWCTEAAFNNEFGVANAASGYFGGKFVNPNYEQVSNKETDHREVVQVYFTNTEDVLKKMLVNYWYDIDPTQANGQFADIGFQYTTAIYYFTDRQKELAEESKKVLENSKKFGDKKIVVEILDGRGLVFYPAEEYHQDYSVKNPARYEYYKNGSGRTDFIKNNWTGDKTFQNFLSQKTVGKQMWLNFDENTKQARIKELSPIQVKVSQHNGTETPFANAYDKNYEKGIYVDIVSGEPLYLSTDKFDSGTGWPSFVKPVSDNAIAARTDNYLIYSRTEVRSKIADSHLGHVFDDGPVDRGGKRYCMNSAAMRFVPIDNMEAEGYGEYVAQVK